MKTTKVELTRAEVAIVRDALNCRSEAPTLRHTVQSMLKAMMMAVMRAPNHVMMAEQAKDKEKADKARAEGEAYTIEQHPLAAKLNAAENFLSEHDLPSEPVAPAGNAPTPNA